jgi:2-dehydropantoate 2-reductase
MNGILSTAVFGGGALGLMYGQAIKQVLGDDLYFIAEGERFRRFRDAVFLINGAEERFVAVRPEEVTRKPDLVLVAVKNYGLPEILPALKLVCGPGTVVVSVLNGIDSEAVLEAAVPEATVLYCCVQGMDAVKDGHCVNFSSRGKILLGARGNLPSSALDAAMSFFARAGLACETPADIHRSIWSKWMLNIGVNQVTAVTGANYGEFRANPHSRALMEAAMREVVQLARAEGVDLREEDIAAWYPVLDRLGAGGKTSMLQDMENRRRTEVESFSGKLIAMARARTIPVPVNETLYRIISVRESLFGR